MMSVRRTVIQLDEETYAELRRFAYEQGRSMASLVRETLAGSFGTKKGRRGSGGLGNYPFVASGSSRPASYTVSEEHDRALGDAIPPQPKRTIRGRARRR
jgi:hypothetical protein